MISIASQGLQQPISTEKRETVHPNALNHCASDLHAALIPYLSYLTTSITTNTSLQLGLRSTN